MTRSATDAVRQLLALILHIEGPKIVSLSLPHANYEFDVSADGVFGDGNGVEAIFVSRLADGVLLGAGLIVRQILPTFFEHMMPDGEPCRHPRGNVYGIRLGDGGWEPLPGEETQRCCTTDPETGERLLPDESATYPEVPAVPVLN